MNDNNLIPTNRRTKSEAREIGKKGGKASGKRRREKREMKELLALAFDMDAKAKNGRVINNPVTGKPMSAKEASMVELVKKINNLTLLMSAINCAISLFFVIRMSMVMQSPRMLNRYWSRGNKSS